MSQASDFIFFLFLTGKSHFENKHAMYVIWHLAFSNVNAFNIAKLQEILHCTCFV